MHPCPHFVWTHETQILYGHIKRKDREGERVNGGGLEGKEDLRVRGRKGRMKKRITMQNEAKLAM